MPVTGTSHAKLAINPAYKGQKALTTYIFPAGLTGACELEGQIIVLQFI